LMCVRSLKLSVGMVRHSERHRTIDSSAHAQSVSIIVPTLNEEENIAPLVSQITACAVLFGKFFSLTTFH